MKFKISFMMFLVGILRCNAGTAPYEPGTPGADWTELQADIIQEKLILLWKTSWNTLRNFDFMNTDAADTDYVFDPTRRLSTLDCDLKEEQCSSVWTSGLRESNMEFTEPKAIRLAFHDCMLYEDGTGGCDGCLNFHDATNADENNMLRPTIAILEKLYLEKDFPSGARQLTASPKDLGISRADLWSFAGLVALDNVQQKSQDLCADQTVYNLTCNDWSSPCSSKFPAEAKQLFKTGRSDCVPNPDATPKQGYLAAKVNVMPDQNGNGPMTAKYFKDNFNMTAKEGLALMGAHTVGRYSTFQTHIDYAWVRAKDSKRNQVFNNEYYKTLVAKPAHVKDKHCVGAMDGGKANVEWHVFARLFEYYWPQDTSKGWNNVPRRLLWHHEVTRAPVCDEEEEDKLGNGMADGWYGETLDNKVKNKGFSSFWEYCCKQKGDGCGIQGTCDPECTRTVQNRIRYLSADVGFYLKWEYDAQGFPTRKYCDVFKKKRASWQWLWGKDLNGGEMPGPANCPKQDMDDGEGKDEPIWKAVELYADNQPKWMSDFVFAWEKFSSNGYDNGDLVQGPSNFWKHWN